MPILLDNILVLKCINVFLTNAWL